MKYFYHSFLVLFVTNVCFAQQQYTFTNYTQEQGLPSGTIRNMYKDTTGYIWLTSEAGVSRFDGYNFKTFRHNPDISSSLPSNIAWYGRFLESGDIYFETQDRYCKFNPLSESFIFNTPFGDSISMFRVSDAKGVRDYYWVISKFSIFRVCKTGTERFALPFTIDLKDWNIVPGTDNRVLLYNWVSSKAGILFFDYQTKIVSVLKIPDRMEDSSSVASVFFTGNNFYLFTKKTSYRFDTTTKTFVWRFDLKHTGSFEYFFPEYLTFNDTLVVIPSKSGFFNIFNIRTGEEKLVYVNKRIPETELNERDVLTLKADNNGGLWMGTAEMGIIHYNVFTGELEQYIHDPGNSNSLPNNFVEYILAGEDGVIWASCFGHGLVKMEPLRAIFKVVAPTVIKKTVSSGGGWSKNIRGFLETDDGYWIATMNGLFSYSNQTKQFSNLQYLCPVSAKDNSTFNKDIVQTSPFGSLARDHAGNLWIGTWYGELILYNTKLNRAFPLRRPEPLKERDKIGVFRNLYCDRKNRMWISTYAAGVSMIDCNALSFEKINETKFEYNFFDAKDSTSISSDFVFVITQDSQGAIWAGTQNGLCKYNEQTKKWKRYYNTPGNPNSLHHNDVRSLCLDNKGTLWIGTNGGGLNRYNKEQDNFTHFTTENGLPNDQIYTVVCDDNGMLWMGTNYGLCRFNPMDYSCKNFSEKDGIQNYEYNTGAAIKLKDGLLLFGGVAGYNIIDPEKIENKKSIPPVVISSFKIFDRETPIGDGHLNLNYDENHLTFEFAALSYYRNQKNRYAYMLQGVDHDWIFTDTRRYVSYSKLEPGHYTFKVKACNSDGVWNETGAQLQITITPPFWRRAWFVILCFSFGIGIIYFINRRERNRVKQLEKVRERISRDLHDDMGSTLQSISVMSEIVRMKSTSDNKQESIPLIEKIGSASREMIDKMNDIVWAVNPKNDHFENIIFHMRSFAGELLAGKDIILHFKADNELNHVKLSMEKRKSFFLVFKEAVNNAYKYSGAKNVWVEISKTNHQLKLIVEDDGSGFNLNDDRLKMDGNGLKNMKSRAVELNGTISITSETGNGTRVSLTVNLS